SLNMKIYKSSTKEIKKADNIISQLLDSKDSIEEKYNKLLNAYQEIKLTPGAENQLITSLINKLAGDIRFPRVGDNNERFDALINFKDYKCLVEIEIPSTAILDAPRNLLDDYAVAVSRHKLSRDEIILVVICWDVPNKRTDYWNVINDINRVLDLEIKTISIPALALHYW